MRRRAFCRSFAAVMLLATACGRQAIVQASQEESDPSAYAIQALSRGAGLDRIPPWYRDLGELLPNTKYEEPGGQPRSITSRVYVGRVVEVAEGEGFWVPEGDAPGGTMVAFSDPRSMWKTVHLRTEVERALDRVSTNDETIWVGLATSPSVDPEKLAQGLAELGPLVFFLYERSPVFDYEPRLAAIVEDGTMVATIEEGGRLGLPALEESRRGPLLAGFEAIEDLVDQADEPSRVVELDRDGGMLVRSGSTRG